jgi:hypothetical protein
MWAPLSDHEASPFARGLIHLKSGNNARTVLYSLNGSTFFLSKLSSAEE